VSSTSPSPLRSQPTPGMQPSALVVVPVPPVVPPINWRAVFAAEALPFAAATDSGKVKKVEPPVASTYCILASAVRVRSEVKCQSDWKRILPVSDGLMRGRYQKLQ